MILVLISVSVSDFNFNCIGAIVLFYALCAVNQHECFINKKGRV